MAKSPPIPAKSGVRTSVLLVHAAFVITGAVATMLGPMLPVLSARWHLNDFEAGYFFTGQFLSALITSAISGTLISRIGYRWSLFVSLLLMAIGVAMLDQQSWQVGMTAVFIYGAGFGLGTPVGNLLIAELNPTNRAAALNVINFSWGLGAVLAPVAVATVQRQEQTWRVTYGVTVLAVLLALSVASTKFEILSDRKRTTQVEPVSSISNERKFYLAFILCILFFTYVGTENCIGGWVASHAHRVRFGTGTFWALMPSIYWGALLIGRASAPLVLKKIKENYLAVAGLILALIGVAAIYAAHSLRLLALGTGLAGLGMSSIFPANLSLLSQWFGSKAPRVGSFVFPSASLGGAILPWLVGLISVYAGSLQRGLLVPLCGVALMLVLYAMHSSVTTRDA